MSGAEARVREYAKQWAAYPGSADIARDIQDVLDELDAARNTPCFECGHS